MTLQEVESQLEAAQREHLEMVATSKARIGELQAERDRLRAQDRVADLVAGLSDAERAALSQSIQASGIPTAEAVGTPGR
jgi:uncharacterized membrane protein YgcG